MLKRFIANRFVFAFISALLATFAVTHASYYIFPLQEPKVYTVMELYTHVRLIRFFNTQFTGTVRLVSDISPIFTSCSNSNSSGTYFQTEDFEYI